MSRQTNVHAALWYLHLLFAVWLNTKSFYCCKILIFILKWNNQLWALFRKAGGDLSGLIVSRVYARSVDEFISGPLGGRGRVCSALPHIHGSVRRVMITHTSPNDPGKAELGLSKRRHSHSVLYRRFSHPLSLEVCRTLMEEAFSTLTVCLRRLTLFFIFQKSKKSLDQSLLS